MALVAHVKCRFTFAMADEFVAKIRATAQFYCPMKKVLADLDVNIEQVQDTPTVGRRYWMSK